MTDLGLISKFCFGFSKMHYNFGISQCLWKPMKGAFPKRVLRPKNR